MTILRNLALLLAASALLLPAAQAQGIKPSGGRAPAFSAPEKPLPSSRPSSSPGLSSPGLSSPALGGSALPNVALPRPGAAAPRQEQADYIVAVVNTEPVTNNEVRARADRIAQQMQQQGASVPPREELLRLVLDRMISDKTQLQLAKETGIKVDDGAVDQAEQNVAQQNKLSVEQLRQRLAADGVPRDELRRELRNQITLQRLRDRELEPKVRITELDIDQFLRDQQKEGAPTDINIAQVLIAVPEGAPAQEVEKLQQKAQMVADKARAGEDFAALAREFSDGPEKSAGGRMGLRSAERYPALFVEATAKLGVGGVAGPIKSGAGFHVLQVVEKGKIGAPGMSVTQNHARHILLRPTKQLSETAARERLADFKRRVESGSGDFAALAREFSQDGSAKDGGDLGWSSPGQYVPEFEQALAGLSPGQIAEPFASRFGLHLVQLLERRDATLSTRQSREVARNLLREKRLDEAFGPWAQEVRGRAYVDVREPPQ
ncbi:MAG: peptidylprolyl isomerase [Burkholderiales bacterium]